MESLIVTGNYRFDSGVRGLSKHGEMNARYKIIHVFVTFYIVYNRPRETRNGEEIDKL